MFIKENHLKMRIILLWIYSLSILFLYVTLPHPKLYWIFVLIGFLIIHTIIRLVQPEEGLWSLVTEGVVLGVSLWICSFSTVTLLMAFLWGVYALLEPEKQGNYSFFLFVLGFNLLTLMFITPNAFPIRWLEKIIWICLLAVMLVRIHAFRRERDKRIDLLQDEILAIKKESSALQEMQEQKMQELTAAKISMEERYAEVYTLQIINEVANSELSIDSLGGKVVDILTGLTGSTACSVILLDQEESPSILATNLTSPTQLQELTGPEAIKLFERTLAKDEPIAMAELEEEPLLKRRGTQSFVTVPLRLKTGGSGVIFLEHNIENAFNIETRKIVLAAADRLAVAIDNARLYDRMEKMAVTDALTGVYNRLYLHQYLDKLFNENTPLALAIMDIDHFKKVNDTYGHLSGDAALKTLSGMIKSMLPANSLIARYGGEEFVVLCADGNLEDIRILAEEIRRRTEAIKITGDNGITFSITVSLGVSALPELAQTVQGVLQSADEALYQAKESGRNRVCIGLPQKMDNGN